MLSFKVRSDLKNLPSFEDSYWSNDKESGHNISDPGLETHNIFIVKLLVYSFVWILNSSENFLFASIKN